MFRVETYKNPIKFYNSVQIGKDELHITSIPTLAMHLKDRARLTNGLHVWNVWIYHHFYRAIYPRWNSVKSKLKQKQILRKLIQVHFKDNSRVKNILQKQLDELCETFRLWREMGIAYLVSDEYDSDLEKAYQKLYALLIAESDLEKLNLEMERPLSPALLSRMLGHYNKTYFDIENLDYSNVKRIYFYCMDYLEPSRITFFKRLEQEGYEVIFRIPNDEEYSNIHQCWHNVYEQFVPYEMWECIQDEEGEKSAFKEFIEGREVTHEPKRKITYHDVAEPVIFKQYLRQHPMNRSEFEYVACCDDDLNEYFRDEIGRKKGLKHFFDMPLGKFISALYSNQTINEDDIIMTYDTFVDMITSGIVSIKSSGDILISGKRALGLLSDLGSYMDGVKSLNEILERLDTYKALNNLSGEFEDLGKSKCDSNRVKRFLQNPLRSIGYVNHNKYSITFNQAYDLGVKLKEMISALTVTYSPVTDFEEHVKQLIEYVKESGLMQEIESKEIKSVYKQFFAVLNTKFNNAEIEELQDMNDYIAMRNKIPSFEEDQGEIIIMKGLEHLAALAVNGVEEIYLCDMSTKSMNRYIRRREQVGHLVSLDDLEKYFMRYEEDAEKQKLLHTIRVARQSLVDTQNFVKFNIATLISGYTGKLHVGWIRNMEMYDTEWYLMSILKDLCEVEIIEEKVEFDEHIFEEIENEQEEKTEGPVMQIQKQISPLAWKELDVCEKRFYLSNILNHYPSYLEDYQLQQAFALLARMLEDQQGGRQAVIDYFFPLFPQWSDALKLNLVETHNPRRIGTYAAFDNVHFPEEMQFLQYLFSNNEDIKKMKNRLSQDKSAKLTEWLKKNKEYLQVNPGKKCYICPYQMVCQEGVLAIEQNSRL